MRPVGTFVSADAVPLVMIAVGTPPLMTDKAVTYGLAATPPVMFAHVAFCVDAASRKDWSGIPVFGGDAALTCDALTKSEPRTVAVSNRRFIGDHALVE
jgi:hypothetical protein